jgi:hypothetical protein
MGSERKILQAPIRAARRTERISISAPSDFALGAATPIARNEASDLRLLPYCLDFVRRRAVYVGGVDAAAAQGAPFYYLYLRRNARFVVSVPWETAPLSHDVARAPVLLFSPGRCGSTLLSRILFEASIANVSEPDFYTQATTQWASGAFNPLRTAMQKAVRAMGVDLCSALRATGPVVAKLRAESCRAPQLAIDPREKRVLCMTRDFQAWARSTERTFRNAPAKMIGKYLTALSCYEYLRQNCDCHLVRYEDLLADPAVVCRKLGAFLGCEISETAIAEAMKKDSQEGTPLAQGNRDQTSGSERRLAQTLALWNSDKVKRIRGRLDAASEIRAR